MSYHDPSRARHYSVLDSNAVSLQCRQQPMQALVTTEHKEKTRKAIDPPPIVQLKVRDSPGPDQGNWLVNPFLFMIVQLYEAEAVNGAYRSVPGPNLLGSTVSSLHRLKDADNKDGGYFVFSDISSRKQGVFRLKFSLFDIEKHSGAAVYISSHMSDAFSVVTSKEFRGQMESTSLSRSFSDQGVRLRLRKEQRTITGTKRPYRDSPRLAANPPAPYPMSMNSMQDRSYAHNPLKRQRSDSDYAQQSYEASHLSNNSMYQYGSHALPPQPHYVLPTSQGESFGSMSSHGSAQPAAMSHWQRPAQHESLPGSTVGYAGYPYYQQVAHVPAAIQREQSTGHMQHHSQPYALRTPEEQTATLSGYPIASSLTGSTLSTPQHHIYTQQGVEMSAHSEAVGLATPTYAMPQQQTPIASQNPYAYRTPLAESGPVQYEPRLQSAGNDASPEQQISSRASAPYNPTHYAGPQDIYSDPPREAYVTGAGGVADSHLPLDAGVLNRGFIPPYPGQPGDPVDSSIDDYKDPPYPYQAGYESNLRDSHDHGPDGGL